MKPKTVSELFDYLESNPWLRRAKFPGGTFRARVDRRQALIWEGATLSYFSCDGATFDEAGFDVPTLFNDTHRFEYAEGEDK